LDGYGTIGKFAHFACLYLYFPGSELGRHCVDIHVFLFSVFSGK
jgi:hypothetical protein